MKITPTHIHTHTHKRIHDFWSKSIAIEAVLTKTEIKMNETEISFKVLPFIFDTFNTMLFYINRITLNHDFCSGWRCIIVFLLMSFTFLNLPVELNVILGIKKNVTRSLYEYGNFHAYTILCLTENCRSKVSLLFIKNVSRIGNDLCRYRYLIIQAT